MGRNNSMALNENNSNEEPIAGAMALQIGLAHGHMSPYYRNSQTVEC